MMSFYKHRFNFFLYNKMLPCNFSYSLFPLWRISNKEITSEREYNSGSLKSFIWEVTKNIRNILCLTRHLTTMRREESFAELAIVLVLLLMYRPVPCQDKTFSSRFWMSVLTSDRASSQFFRITLEPNSPMEFQENSNRLGPLEVILPKLKAGQTSKTDLAFPAMAGKWHCEVPLWATSPCVSSLSLQRFSFQLCLHPIS